MTNFVSKLMNNWESYYILKEEWGNCDDIQRELDELSNRYSELETQYSSLQEQYIALSNKSKALESATGTIAVWHCWTWHYGNAYSVDWSWYDTSSWWLIWMAYWCVKESNYYYYHCIVWIAYHPTYWFITWKFNWLSWSFSSSTWVLVWWKTGNLISMWWTNASNLLFNTSTRAWQTSSSMTSFTESESWANPYWIWFETSATWTSLNPYPIAVSIWVKALPA